MIEIEKNIPAPTRWEGFRSRQYPFASMQIGDSFFVEGTERKIKTHMLVNASRWAKREGLDRKFSIKKEETGYRLWRIV